MTNPPTSIKNIESREPKTVLVDLQALWFLQRVFSYNSFMFDPRSGKEMFPGTVGEPHAAWRVRDKVNRLICRFELEQEHGLLPLPLDYDECWYIDALIDAGSFMTARPFLVQVFQCIWEHEYGFGLQTKLLNRDKFGEPDGPLDPTQLLEYIARQQDKSGWYEPQRREDDRDL